VVHQADWSQHFPVEHHLIDTRRTDSRITSEAPVPAVLALTDSVMGTAIFATRDGSGRWLAVDELCSRELTQFEW
jgi:hypothetical protein